MIFTPLIDDMKWSYSRVRSFDDCPYKFFLKYVRSQVERPMFYSSYGKFMHSLLERYYRNEENAESLCGKYLREFRENVTGSPQSLKVFSNYFNSGLSCIKTLMKPPGKIVGVEKKVEFDIGGYPSIGYLDLVCETDDGLCIIDHKSRMLKRRSGRRKPTATDAELDSYLRQLYIYSAAIKNESGELPTHLCFNCFRENLFIKEQFYNDAYEEAIRWYTDSIEKIRMETDFRPSIDYFKCTYLCGLNDRCEYYQLFMGR